MLGPRQLPNRPSTGQPPTSRSIFAIRFQRAVFAAFAASLVSAPAVGAPLQPTGKWVVNFDSAQCFAARNYGTIAKPVYLVIKAPPLGGVMQIVVMRKGAVPRPQQLTGSLEFGHSDSLKIKVLEYQEADSGLKTYRANLKRSDFDAIRSASDVRIWIPGLDERFALSSIPALLDTMDSCVDDLRIVWNVGDSKNEDAPLAEGAKGDLRALFSGDDYPTQALVVGESGIVAVVLLIDEKGKVRDCSVIETSGAPVLDAQACAVLTERALFRPALGLDGKPAKSAIVQRIDWQVR